MTQTPPPQPLMNTPPGNVTTEQIQKYLDENKQLIMAILEHQSVGRIAECSSLQSQLQQNLMYLAKIADAQPPPPQPQGTTPPPPPPPPPNPQVASVQQEQQQQQQQHYIQASQGQMEWPQQQHQQPMYLQQAPRHPFQMNDAKQQQQQQQQQQLQRSYQG